MQLTVICRLSTLLKRYPDIQIPHHSFPLVTIHRTNFQRPQSKIIGKSEGIAGEEIGTLIKLALIDDIVEENISFPGQENIAEKLVAVANFKGRKTGRIK